MTTSINKCFYTYNDHDENIKTSCKGAQKKNWAYKRYTDPSQTLSKIDEAFDNGMGKQRLY